MADLACSMSGDEDGVKIVRLAVAQIENLCPQVGRKCEAFRIIINEICYVFIFHKVVHYKVTLYIYTYIITGN